MQITCDYDDNDQYYEDEYMEEMEDKELKSLEEISIYDLMGSEYDIWITKNKNFGFDIEIDNDEYETILHEKELHPFAVESLVTFCKKVLLSYARYENNEVTK